MTVERLVDLSEGFASSVRSATGGRPERGRRILRVSRDLIVRTLRDGNIMRGMWVEVGLPEDAEIIGHFDDQVGNICFILSSSAWPALASGAVIPTFTVSVRERP